MIFLLVFFISSKSKQTKNKKWWSYNIAKGMEFKQPLLNHRVFEDQGVKLNTSFKWPWGVTCCLSLSIVVWWETHTTLLKP